MKKPSPPRKPYCLCGSLWRWILQQGSLSLHFMYYFSGANHRANAYFEKVKDYQTKLIWKWGIYTPQFRTRFAGVWMIFPDFTVRRADND